MIRNYFLTAIRNMKKNKVFSLINILGLALGLACSMLIFLWVQDEKSVDAFYPNKERLYIIYERQYYDGKIEAGYYTPGILAAEMKRVLPEVEYATNFNTDETAAIQVGDKIIKEKGGYASPDFFRVFGYPLLKGDASTAVSSPESIAISRKMAGHFFGSPEAAFGKTIRFQNTKDFKVTAVFEDINPKSSFKFVDFFVNWSYYQDQNPWTKEWGNNSPATALMLKQGTDPVKLGARIRKFLDGYNKEMSKAFYIELGMQRFDETYLHSNFKNGEISGGRVEYVRLFLIIAVFILIIACINFMNLTTARASKRAREIGMRKVVGALKGSLRGQFLGEAILLAAISTSIAFLMVRLVLPTFNQLTEKEISLPLSSPLFWIELIGLTIITGVFAGSYPALFLSSFSPIKVLKGTLKFSTGATLFRKGLVVFQFTLSILLIVGTIIISQQVNYIQNKNIGFDKENLLYVVREGNLKRSFDVFKAEAMKMPGIKMISTISEPPTEIGSSTNGVDWDGKAPNTVPAFTPAAVGYDFCRTAGVQIVAGRDFSKDFATDSVGYVINETAAQKMGFGKKAVGQRLTFWGKKGSVIGVIKDFHFSSMHTPIKPLILRYDLDNNDYFMLVRTEAGKSKEAMASLEKLCKTMNPAFPMSFFFAREEYQRLYKSEQVIGSLSRYFAFLAIFISCLGLLGLAMFTAEQRVREMGIRKVLGASVSSLFGLLSKEFLIPVVYALLVASPIAWWAMNHWLQDFEYRVGLHWWVFLLAGAIAVLIALLTTSLQAIKAALINPIKNLRAE